MIEKPKSLKAAPVLGHLRFWTTRGEHQSTRRAEEHDLLRQLAQRWRCLVVHHWNRGFAGAPWLELALLYQMRFIVHWNKIYRLIGPKGYLLKA